MKSNEVYVIAGGPSLIGFDFSVLKDKDVICVNKSIINVDNPKYFVTMDYTFLGKIDLNLFKTKKCTKFFIANLSLPYMDDSNGKISDTRFNLIYDLKDFDCIIKSRQETGIGNTFNSFIHGANSGFCGLQLALILGYTNIHLLGFDLSTTDVTHYHGGYGEKVEKFNDKLEKYIRNFEIAFEEIKNKFKDVTIFSYCKTSILNKFVQYRELNSIKITEIPDSINISDAQIFKFEQDKYKRMWDKKEYTYYSSECNALSNIETVFRTRPIKDILIVGCGEGHGIHKLTRAGYTVKGLDLVDAIKYNEYKSKLVIQPAWDTKFSDIEFDLIVSIDVLEHIPEQKIDSTLNELRRIGKFFYFTIACRKDKMGELINETLHLTVKTPAWWVSKISKYFSIEKYYGSMGEITLYGRRLDKVDA